jgi:putative membrane protein
VVIRPLFAADYMAAASSIDLYEIRSSELALTRAQSARLRDFARTMIAAHTGTSAQLSFAGRRLNLLPSATLLPQHQAMMDELAASGDFDRSYRRQQITVHQAALKLHSDFAARGESATLRPVAANAAAVVRRHLETLRRM